MDYIKLQKNKSLAGIINVNNGQLISLQTDSNEFMHSGGRDSDDHLRDTRGWKDSDKELFPIVSSSKDNVILYDGEKFPLDQHGIVRVLPTTTSYTIKGNMKVTDEVKIRHEYKSNTKYPNPKYKEKSDHPEYMFLPFSFSLESTCKISDDSFIKTTSIENTSDKPFCYAFGQHPAFKSQTDNPKNGIFYDKSGKYIKHEISPGKEVPLTLDILLGISKASAKDPTKLSAVVLDLDSVFYFAEDAHLGVKVESNHGKIMLWSPAKNMFCIESITDIREKGTTVDLSKNGSYKCILYPGNKQTYVMGITPL